MTENAKIADRRAAVTHGLAWVAGLVLGAIGLAALAPRTARVDDDLAPVALSAVNRGADYWAARLGPQWRRVTLELYTGGDRTKCGAANVSTGPFYCAASGAIYLDLGFLRSIVGDLARGYVVAHELGHHVQALRGELTGRPSEEIELQADCYAGEWMRDELLHHHLSAADLDSALAEAAAVGDPPGTPEKWAHGTSGQRVQAVRDGLDGQGCKIQADATLPRTQ